MGPHVITRTLMTLARHRDYRTTRRYVRVDGDHLRAAVERLADRGCHPDATLVDSLLASVENPEDTGGASPLCCNIVTRRRWGSGGPET